MNKNLEHAAHHLANPKHATEVIGIASSATLAGAEALAATGGTVGAATATMLGIGTTAGSTAAGVLGTIGATAATATFVGTAVTAAVVVAPVVAVVGFFSWLLSDN